MPPAALDLTDGTQVTQGFSEECRENLLRHRRAAGGGTLDEVCSDRRVL
jgi:hypothetical protein